MEYKITEKAPFTVMGICRKFHPETGYQEIPKFWGEVMGRPDCPVMGIYGVCIDNNGPDGEFDYWIADNYLPCQEIPAGCGTTVIPGGMWAIFPCSLATLQETNTRMWQEWLPNSREYKLRGNYNLEFYTAPDADAYTELWLPVEKI